MQPRSKFSFADYSLFLRTVLSPKIIIYSCTNKYVQQSLPNLVQIQKLKVAKGLSDGKKNSFNLKELEINAKDGLKIQWKRAKCLLSIMRTF